MRIREMVHDLVGASFRAIDGERHPHRASDADGRSAADGKRKNRVVDLVYRSEVPIHLARRKLALVENSNAATIAGPGDGLDHIHTMQTKMEWSQPDKATGRTVTTRERPRESDHAESDHARATTPRATTRERPRESDHARATTRERPRESDHARATTRERPRDRQQRPSACHPDTERSEERDLVSRGGGWCLF